MHTPSYSPVKKEELLCHDCGNVMRTQINKMGNGRIVSVFYYCDTCKYGQERSDCLAHCNPAKYDREETPAKPAKAGKA